jgi:hypothetical protein
MWGSENRRVIGKINALKAIDINKFGFLPLYTLELHFGKTVLSISPATHPIAGKNHWRSLTLVIIIFRAT